MRRVHRTALAAAALLTLLLPDLGRAAPANPWITGGVLNIAHRGGRLEFPEHTLYAYRETTKPAVGTDVLELDVHATSDGEVVVIHDATVDRTTNGSGRVDSMTLAQVQALDAAHHWPDLRGIAQGTKTPPAGYGPADFRIPTLEEVLVAFPTTPINIEIKSTAPETIPYEKTIADLLAAHNRTDDVIVVSFLDHAVEVFKAWAPDVHTATATGETAAFWATARGPGAPNPRYVAMQVPITFNGIEVVDRNGDFVAKAHANGLAVHVWTVNTRAEMEWLIDAGVDGIMTDRPSLLQQVLLERGLA